LGRSGETPKLGGELTAVRASLAAPVIGQLQNVVDLDPRFWLTQAFLPCGTERRGTTLAYAKYA
jgi:hypothetical protein